MQLTVALLSAAVAVSASQGHHHQHRHLHHEKKTVDHPVDGPTEVVYVLNGSPIPEYEVQQGLKNGTLILADDGQLASASSPAPAYTPTPSPSVYVAPTTSAEPSPVETSSAAEYTPPAAPSPAPSKPQPKGEGLDSEFPDGEIDCSHFPSEYGPIPLDWHGLGGWTGIQNPGSGGLLSGFADILTVLAGNTCGEGDYCSYACPSGYQKSQWPTTQGATGQSVGGLHCKGGKLYLTNPELSKSLCMTGATEVSIMVRNELSQNVAVCRTDYPGTESETIPVDTQPGATDNLTCPDAAKYYTWQGGRTSAQYYVNPAGVPVEKACTWGSEANPWGNFAPMNLGVGYSAGSAWLSIFQNAPTTDAKLEFTVEIIADYPAPNIDGSPGSCRYKNGQYCTGKDYGICNTKEGCQMNFSTGGATFVFSA